MTHIDAKPKNPRWLIVATIFGGTCDVLCWIASFYQFVYLLGDRAFWNPNFIFVQIASLVPLLVLLALHRSAPVVVLYAVILCLLLAWRCYYLVQYYKVGMAALNVKVDEPGFLLLVLGVVSIAVLAIWVAARCVAKAFSRLHFSNRG